MNSRVLQLVRSTPLRSIRTLGSPRPAAAFQWARIQRRTFLSTADIPTKNLPEITRATATNSNGNLYLDADTDQRYRLDWAKGGPKTVLIIKKANDQKVDNALVDIANWLHSTYTDMNIVLEPPVYTQVSQTIPFARTIPEGESDEYSRVVDFVITLGGDGTFLHVSSLFKTHVPPIIPFSMGTLGFLLPFNVATYKEQLQAVIAGGSTVLPRMRLSYSKYDEDGELMADGHLNITNEACIHRGTYPHLTTIACYINNQLLTTSVGDGIIVGTPTGSTAYSLSAGGPIVHPLVSSMILTPVCPRSLSFRPLILPASAVVRLQVHKDSRGRAAAYIDGRNCGELRQDQSIEIRRSAYPLMCINRENLAAGWTHDINRLLKFNRTFSYPHEAPFGDHADPDDDA